MLCAGPLALIDGITKVLNELILGETAHVSHTVKLAHIYHLPF